MKQRYLEDFTPGMSFDSTGTVSVTAQEIIDFAKQYDPQYFHTDPAAAEKSLFGGLVASGWMTAGLTMRLIINSNIDIAGGMIGRGVESVEWPVPVRPGDVLRAQSEVLEVIETKNPARGRVRVRTQTFNQKDEMVMSMISIQVVLKRKSALSS